MFVLHSSNKTENLVAHLTAVIENSPLASPFEKEVVIIQRNLKLKILHTFRPLLMILFISSNTLYDTNHLKWQTDSP